MTAPGVGCPKEAGKQTVKIEIFQDGRAHSGFPAFYADDGQAAAGYSGHKRYKNDSKYDDYDCNRDRDTCETMGTVRVNGGPPNRCEDKFCTLYVVTP